MRVQFAVASAVLACQAAEAQGPPLERCVTAAGRRACVVGPDARGLPLIVFLHGYGGAGADDTFGIEPDALKNRFLYARPEALPNETGDREWRSGDVEFLRELIPSLLAATGSDRRRVYLVGFSLGGFLALEFACAQPGLIAAVVTMSGTLFDPAPECKPGSVSVLELHGKADTGVSPQGGVGKRTGRRYLSAQAAAAIAAAAAGCRAALAAVKTGGAGGLAERASKCRNNAIVEYRVIDGVGHAPPAGPAFGRSVLSFLHLGGDD